MKLKISKLIKSLFSGLKSLKVARSLPISARSTRKLRVLPSVKGDYYIYSQDQLRKVISLIEQRKIVALDTEFTRRNTYFPILSIVQVAVKNDQGKKESFIIDCLSDLDLTEFFKVINDENIVKILHSASQDLQIFYRESKLLPRNIIDTQILANFCGLGFNIGYSNLVDSLFQKQLNKKQQNSDWQKRPLSQSQIRYALLDVFYLEEIYEKLITELAAQNRLSWFSEEMKNFVKKTNENPAESLLKKFSFRRKNPQQISQIKYLIYWREDWARELNIPRQRLISDEQIEDLVTQKISVENLGKKVTNKMIKEISKILNRTEESEAETISLSGAQKLMLEEAKKIVTRISLEKNFKEQFLVTNAELKKIIYQKDCLKEILVGWRYELIGDELNNLINS